MEYKYFELKLTDNITRKLPIVTTGSGLKIAGFDSVGDIELLTYAAADLMFQLKSKVDYILTTEVKGIPIAQEIAKLLGVPYICLRKQYKVYMGNYIEFEGSSVTSGVSNYFISRDQANAIYGKNVLFVDDVYSTGSTMTLIETVCEYLQSNLVGGAFILKEQSAQDSYTKEFKHNNIDCYSVAMLPLMED